MKPGGRMGWMEESASTESWVDQWKKGQCGRAPRVSERG